MVGQDEQSKPKKLVFITHTHKGSLGDPSSCLKVARLLSDKTKTEAQVNLLIDSNGDDDKIKKLVDNEFPLTLTDLAQIPANGGVSYYESNEDIKKLIEDADAVVFYPTLRMVKFDDFKAIANLNSNIICGDEYNFDEEFNYANPWIKSSVYNPSFSVVFHTGLGDTKSNNQGIFLKDAPNDSNPISRLTEKKGETLKNLLLGSSQPVQTESREKQYHQSHDFYFAYYNQFAKGQGKTEPLDYIKFCLNRSKEKNNIDFVLPLSELDQSYPLGVIDLNSLINELKDQFPQDQYTFEYHKINDGKETTVTRFGQGAKVVRLINPYPMPPDMMNKLMQASSDFIMVTGDQSLSEAISLGKIPFYQIMYWKKGLANGLIEASKQYLGLNAELTRYFESFTTDNADSAEDFFNKSKILSKQMEQLRKALFEHQNLSKNLPNFILESIESYDTKVKNRIMAQEEISYNTAFHKIYSENTLFKMFDQHKAVLADIGFDPVLWAACHRQTSLLIKLIEQPDNVKVDNIFFVAAVLNDFEMLKKYAKDNNIDEDRIIDNAIASSNQALEIDLIPYLVECRDKRFLLSIIDKTPDKSRINAEIIQKVIEYAPQLAEKLTDNLDPKEQLDLIRLLIGRKQEEHAIQIAEKVSGKDLRRYVPNILMIAIEAKQIELSKLIFDKCPSLSSPDNFLEKTIQHDNIDLFKKGIEAQHHMLDATWYEKLVANDSISSVVKDNFPVIAEDNFPSIEEDSLPSIAEDNFPSFEEDSFPSIAEDNFPSIEEDSFPSIAEDNFPSFEEDSFPSIAEDNLPSIKEDSFPSTEEDSSLAVDEDNFLSAEEDSILETDEDSLPSLSEDSLDSPRLPSMGEIKKPLTKECNLLSIAINACNLEAIDAILQIKPNLINKEYKSYDVNSNKQVSTPLSIAAKVNNEQVFSKVLEKYLEINNSDHNDENLLQACNDPNIKENTQALKTLKNTLNLLSEKSAPQRQTVQESSSPPPQEHKRNTRLTMLFKTKRESTKTDAISTSSTQKQEVEQDHIKPNTTKSPK